VRLPHFSFCILKKYNIGTRCTVRIMLIFIQNGNAKRKKFNRFEFGIPD